MQPPPLAPSPCTERERQSSLFKHQCIHGLLFLLMLALSGCATAGDPAQTVQQYLQAKVDGDHDALQRLLCSDMETDLEREAASFAGLDASLKDVTCQRNGDTDTVTCTGAIVAVYNGENRDFPLGTYRVVQEDGEWKWCGETK